MKPPNNKIWVIGLYFLSTLSIAGLIYTAQDRSENTSLAEGQNSPLTYTAPREVLIINKISTQRAREAARSQIPTIFSVDTSTEQLVIEGILSSGFKAETYLPLLEAYMSPDGVS